MKTTFAPDRLADPAIAEIDRILRTCVHCGFCTATCPTYVELGDERDSPRGRIYLIKDLYESGEAPDHGTVGHIDRCLTCLSCMTTCPSGVDYVHLVDQARQKIEAEYERPAMDRLVRRLLKIVLPNPGLFRWALRGSALARPLAGLLPDPFRTMIGMAPRKLPRAFAGDRPQIFPAEGARKRRVALMTGCAQQVLDPDINAATVRLLTRHGCEVVVARGAGCCGALTQHMGDDADAKRRACANIDAWERERKADGLDAIVINASGCGTTVKDYGHLLADDPAYAEPARRIAALARDISEVMAEIGLNPSIAAARGRTVAYHAACSLQHGQRVREAPKDLLRAAGFTVVEPAESHLCCGSAGTYNLLQPDLATRLRDRKVGNLAATGAPIVAAGNIGCLVQLSQGFAAAGAAVTPVHIAGLLDWATGGPIPAGME